jgi:hypothetical protein
VQKWHPQLRAVNGKKNQEDKPLQAKSRGLHRHLKNAIPRGRSSRLDQNVEENN